MKLNELADNFGASKKPKRVGRGIASGTGKTSGRGHKGAKSRSGVSIKGFEGGQMPIYRRLPKRGFTNIFREANQVINIGKIQSYIDNGKIDSSEKLDLEKFKSLSIIKSTNSSLRLLAKGELTSKLNIEVHSASKSAIAAVEKAGGKVLIVDNKKEINDLNKSKTKVND